MLTRWDTYYGHTCHGYTHEGDAVILFLLWLGLLWLHLLTRWDRARPAALDNLLLLTKACAEQHDAAAAPRAAVVAAHSSHFVLAVERSLRRAAEEGVAWRKVGTAS